MRELTLILPFPPSVNNYKTIGKIVKTKTGKLYQERRNSNETKMFYYECYLRCKRFMPSEQSGSLYGGDKQLGVAITLQPPLKTSYTRWDLDNRLKVLLDALMYCRIIEDDSQIHRLVVEKGAMIEQGQSIVTIKEFLQCPIAQST